MLNKVQTYRIQEEEEEIVLCSEVSLLYLLTNEAFVLLSFKLGGGGEGGEGEWVL